MGEIADGMIEGFSCSWCGVCFEESHGYPVVCQDCYKNWKREETAKGKQANGKRLLREFGLQIASNKEL